MKKKVRSKKFDQHFLDEFLILIEKKPDFAEAYNNLAHILLIQHRYDEALTNVNKAIKIKPNFFQALIIQAKILLNKNKTIELKHILHQMINLNPRAPEIYFQIGKIYINPS